MKKLLLISIVLISLSTFAQEMNVISYNIRYNNPGDGENAWPNRKDNVTALLKFHDADIFGLQEALHEQVNDVATALHAYKWIGVGRDDGKEKGEYSPIFFNTEKFDLKKKGWFWLSEECNKPGLGWDAACTRICTWVVLTEKASSKDMLVLNTHFDHRGDIAREKSADLILQKIKEINTSDLPVLLMGDFNLTPDRTPIVLIKKQLKDSKEVSEQAAYGPEGTYNQFNFNHPIDGRIDYIFVNEKVQVKKYAVISDSKNRKYPSDHMPVFVQINLK